MERDMYNAEVRAGGAGEGVEAAFAQRCVPASRSVGAPARLDGTLSRRDEGASDAEDKSVERGRHGPGEERYPVCTRDRR